MLLEEGSKMGCINCKWFLINRYVFEDGTRTCECTKHNRFLGFTDKNGAVKELKRIDYCPNTILNNPGNNEEDEKRNLPKDIHYSPKSKTYFVTAYNGEKVIRLGTFNTLEKAIKIKEMYRDKKSWIRGVSWDKTNNVWIAQFWDKVKKKPIRVGQYKDIKEAARKLEEFKKKMDGIR